MKNKSIMRCIPLALSMILLISLILINPVNIYADVGGGISPRFDPILIVGQVDDLAHTGIGAITESDAQTGCDIRITKVSLIPSCGALGPGVCTAPDPGVITIHDANGVLIAAEGIAFNAQCSGAGVPFGCCTGAGTGNCNGCVGSQWKAQLTNAALGLYEFTPTADVILVAPNDTTPPPGCVLSFGIDVIKLPTIDYTGAPGLQTSRIAFWEGLTLNCPNSGGNSFPASGTGIGASTVAAPDYTVTKTGTSLSKIGDSVTYNYSITSTGGVNLNLVSVVDDKAGNLTVTANAAGCDVLSLSETCNFTANYTVKQSDPDPLFNTVTVTYNLPTTAINIVHTDTHSVNLFQPCVNIIKDCGCNPTDITVGCQAGDEIEYIIIVNNCSSTDTPTLNCTITDPLLAINKNVTLASGGQNVTNKTRTLQSTDPNPLVNTASVHCTIQGFPNVFNKQDSCATVNTEFPVSITPSKGGNAGQVTATIIGNNFVEGTNAKLICNGQEIIGNNTVISSSYQLTTTFDLVGANPGPCDLVVDIPGSDPLTCPDCFTVEEGGEVKLWVEIVGRQQVRVGRESTFSIVLGNAGNVDESFTMVTLEVPAGSNVESMQKQIELHSMQVSQQMLLWPVYSNVVDIIPPGGVINLPVPLVFFKDGCLPVSATISLPSLEELEDCLKNGTPAEKEKCCDTVEEYLWYLDQEAVWNRCLKDYGEAACKAKKSKLLDLWKTYCSIGTSSTNESFLCDHCERGQQNLLKSPDTAIDSSLQDVSASTEVCAVTSIDPNDKAGPAGFDLEGTPYDQLMRYIASDHSTTYMVFFENLETATAAAQEVLITDQLDTNLDWTTFSFGTMQVGEKIISVPDDIKNFQTTIDLRPDINALVDIDCKLTLAPGVFECLFRGKDPDTSELADFLPPNTDVVDPKGRGWISYSVMRKPGLPTGTVIKNKATIDFEVDIPPDPMDTPEVFNTIDSGIPTSSVSPLSATQTTPIFTVSWGGNDDAEGSGIKNYDIYASDNGGPYTLWLTTQDTSATFTGVNGHQYSFYSRARDNVGNIEDAPANPDATTTITGSQYIRLVLPIGGEIIPSGGIYGICWEAPLNAVKFDLKYSTDNGGHWTAIKSVTGLNCTHWEEVPVVTANKRQCRVKVIGYDSNGALRGGDMLCKPFTIEVLRVTSPNAGETLKSGDTSTIRWITHKTIRPVAKTVLKYTTDGTTWKSIKTLTGNPGIFKWKVPAILSTKCKVKVILKDAGGANIGTDISDKFFMIQP